MIAKDFRVIAKDLPILRIHKKLSITMTPRKYLISVGPKFFELNYFQNKPRETPTNGGPIGAL